MNRILVIAVALLITISSSLYAGPFGLFGRGRSSCANGSCNSCNSCSRSATVIITDSTNSIDSTPVKDACCDCKCGCDLCKCATECCVNNAGKCNCACGCPNCTCANTVIVPQGANNNYCATCNSGSCGPNSSCSQNSQVIMRSRSRSAIIYGRKTPIRNILKKLFHR